MTRKRFVKLSRALSVNMRELGYRNDKIDRMIRILHSGKGSLHNDDDSVMSYQDAWTHIRKNAWDFIVNHTGTKETESERKLLLAIFYPIFFIDD